MDSRSLCVVSVFIPVYNGEKYLEKTIKSVQSQTVKDWELVCVDDSSSDNSYEILLSFAKTDSRIKVFKKPNGGNTAKSWNFAFPYLNGRFICYMSQDDWMAEDTLALNLSRQKETNADIVIPDLEFVNTGTNRRLEGLNGNHDVVLSGKQAFLLSLSWKIHGFTLCRAEIMKGEPFDEELFNSDEYITRKNFLVSNKVAFSKGNFFYNRTNENAITRVFKLYTLSQLKTDRKIVQLMFKNNIERTAINGFLKSSFLTLISFQFSLYNFRKSNKLNSQVQQEVDNLFREHFEYSNEHWNIANLSLKERLFFGILLSNYTVFKGICNFWNKLRGLRNRII